MELLLIYLAGLCDRLRGAGFDFGLRIIDQLTYGWVIAAILGHPVDLLTPAIAAAFALGSAPGWGDTSSAIMQRRELNPLELNRWQIGILEKNKWASAAARGVIWGLPVALLGFFDPVLIAALAAMPIAYIGAAYLAGFFPGKNDGAFTGSPWGWMESMRGWLAGALFTLAGLM